MAFLCSSPDTSLIKVFSTGEGYVYDFFSQGSVGHAYIPVCAFQGLTLWSFSIGAFAPGSCDFATRC